MPSDERVEMLCALHVSDDFRSSARNSPDSGPAGRVDDRLTPGSGVPSKRFANKFRLVCRVEAQSEELFLSDDPERSKTGEINESEFLCRNLEDFGGGLRDIGATFKNFKSQIR